jgi:hypothetical protein
MRRTMMSTYCIKFRAAVHILGFTRSMHVLHDAKPLDGEDTTCGAQREDASLSTLRWGPVLAEARDALWIKTGREMFMLCTRQYG